MAYLQLKSGRQCCQNMHSLLLGSACLLQRRPAWAAAGTWHRCSSWAGTAGSDAQGAVCPV